MGCLVFRLLYQPWGRFKLFCIEQTNIAAKLYRSSRYAVCLFCGWGLESNSSFRTLVPNFRRRGEAGAFWVEQSRQTIKHLSSSNRPVDPMAATSSVFIPPVGRNLYAYFPWCSSYSVLQRCEMVLDLVT